MKIKKNYICEYLDDDKKIFSNRGSLHIIYEAENKKNEIIRVGNFLDRVISHSKLLKRLFRLQFYSCIASDSKIFICWKKNIYIWSEGILNRITFKTSDFRILRNGALLVDPNTIVFGEYFDNAERRKVYVYSVNLTTLKYKIIYEFKEKSIRHIHSIKKVSNDTYLIMTGDIENENKIVLINKDGEELGCLGHGSEDYRAIYASQIENKIIYGTDAQFSQNYIYELSGKHLIKLLSVDGPIFDGLETENYIYFTVAVEGAPAQKSNNCQLISYHKKEKKFNLLLSLGKDNFSKKYFQFGQILLPYLNGYSKDMFYINTLALRRKDSGLYIINKNIVEQIK